MVVLPGPGPLARDLEAADIEVVLRPELAVIRRGLASPTGMASLGRGLAADAAFLRRIIRSRGAALVHSNTTVVLGGAAAARVAGVPHVWHVREIYEKWGRAWPVHKRVLLAGASALPCVSAATAAQFGDAPDVTVLHDGLGRIPSRAAMRPARDALGLPQDVPIVAVLGRLTDWKGQDQLIRALALPALRDRGALGLLAGSVWPGAEEREQRIIDLARELGVLDRVVRVGFRDDVENVYGAANVIAVPSTAPDPLPNTALEAAATGCAVIAAAHGGLPEIIRDGETGLLFTPGDPAALAAAAARLLDDRSLAAHLGRRAGVDVHRRFSPEALIDGLQSLYDSLL